MRITPDNIAALTPNQVFVFGSNSEGANNGGAAWYADKFFGAEYGKSEGESGQSYAIPTCTASLEKLPLPSIMLSVSRFIAHAKLNKNADFLVTPIGCGIAGFAPEEIAPMFSEAASLENVWLPQSFINILTKK